MRQPDFFVVGAAKSGTTALWKYFQKHPDVFVTDTIEAKELGYYSNQYGVSSKSEYLSFFKNAEPDQLIGEVCHVYLTSNESADWIKQEVPNAKIIIMLRNPVERAYSLYNWMIMHGYEYQNSFEKALEQEKLLFQDKKPKHQLLHRFRKNYHYFNSGKYYEQVKRFYDFFGKANVLVIEYDNFNKNQIRSLTRIFEFLKIDKTHDISELKTNESNRVKSVLLQYWLRKLYLSRYGINPRVKQLINTIMSKNITKKKPKKINEDTKLKLRDNYKEDVQKLTQLTGIDFYKKWYD